MLVLTRRIDESIVLTLPDGQIITVMVTEVINNNVRIGISAPEKFLVLREELNNFVSAQID